MPTSHATTTLATNTITIPNIPMDFFDSPSVFEDLRNCLQVYGSLHTFVAIKGFARIMAVFEETQSAILAKNELDKTEIGWVKDPQQSQIHLVRFGSEDGSHTTHDDVHCFLLRLYYGQHTDINPDSATVSLQVPELEKNWLISPPGSPPVGWQQIREDPPNATVLPQDLSHALLALGEDDLDDFQLDAEHQLPVSQSSSADVSSTATPSPVVYVITKDELHDGKDVPQITVQDWDGGAQHHNLAQYRRIHRRVQPTAMPPRPDSGPSLEDRPATPIPMSR